MQHQTGTVEALLGRMAFSAFGLVRRDALLRAGASRQQIRSRLASGALLLEYPGVYRVGHRAPSMEATYLAAVWACGDGALLAGQAGGHLLRLLMGPAPPPEVIAPAERRIQGITTRRYRNLHPTEAMKWRRIPVTSVARTLVDLAPVLSVNALARACHEAGINHHTTPAQVEAVLARRRSAPGSRKLREVLRGDARVTLSRLEARFLEILQEENLPLPATNRRVGGYRVDCRWPDHKLTVELDSYRFHNSRYSWEQGYRRRREARARGDEFRRYSFGDVFEEPEPMRAELRELLSHPS